ncbi:hypothetical protein P4N68_05225 [Corynebacterium felinum]|nr:hypothetical protein [Corynebacterium felinum]MDF5820481.1 hypothetical protein [Corynebacterium felinum]WJY94144.1 hypothetical protein CFELI_02510 [Corynebacterium felinum]
MMVLSAKPGRFLIILALIVGLVSVGLGAFAVMNYAQYSWLLYLILGIGALTPALVLSTVTVRFTDNALVIKQYAFEKTIPYAEITAVSLHSDLPLVQAFGYNTDGDGATMLCASDARAEITTRTATFRFSISEPEKFAEVIADKVDCPVV